MHSLPTLFVCTRSAMIWELDILPGEDSSEADLLNISRLNGSFNAVSAPRNRDYSRYDWRVSLSTGPSWLWIFLF